MELTGAADRIVEKKKEMMVEKMEMVKERAAAAGQTVDGEPEDTGPDPVEQLAAATAEMTASVMKLVENLSKPKTITLPSGKTATVQ